MEQIANLSTGNCRLGSNPCLSAIFFRGVAQPGYRACFGSRRPQVRILPPRLQLMDSIQSGQTPTTFGCQLNKNFQVAQLSWIEQLTSNEQVPGSNPGAITKSLDSFIEAFLFWSGEMEDGSRKMEDGRWKMEDGRWKMEVGSQKLEARSRKIGVGRLE